MIKISDKSKKILEKYNIDYKQYDNVDDLLCTIDEEELKFYDKNQEPLKEYFELEKVYDEIFDNN